MDKLFTIKTLGFAIGCSVMLLFTGLPVSGQIYAPDGLRMPGDWNGFSNSNGMGGAFDLTLETTGTSRYITDFQYMGTTGSQSFKFVSGGGDPWVNQWANTSFSINTLTGGIPFCASCNPPNNTITVTNGKWYHVNYRNIGYATTSAIFMETSAAPVTLASVSNSLPGGATAALPSAAVTVSVTTSAAPSTEERIFIRYSTNSFSSSSYVQATPTALPTVWEAIIPGQADGATVEYYVFTSTVADPSSEYDMFTIRFNNNGGSNYSYNVAYHTSVGAGNWNSTGTWNVGTIPNSSSVIVRINSDVTLDVDATVSSISLNGGTLTDGGAPNTLSIAAGGNFNKGAGSFSAGTGTVAFLGAGTRTGGAMSFYNVSVAGGLLDMGSAATVTNNFSILTGGSVVNNRPLYATGSTLIYNTGGNYNTSIEWEGTGPTTRPYNVRVTGGTDLHLSDPTVFTFVYETNGDLILDGTGTSLIVENSASDVGVFGSLNIGVGTTMSLNNEAGDDLFVRGNWTNNGTFNSNERAVFFDNANVQTVSGNTTMDYLIVDKSGGSATLQSGATLNIDNGLTTTTNFSVAGGGNLTLKSDADATAWLNNYSGGNVSGNLTMQRYIPAGPAGFRFISSPLSGTTINGDWSEVSPSGSGYIVPTPTCSPTQTDVSSPYGNVMRLDETHNTLAGCTQDNWEVVSSGAMTPGRGYAVFVSGGATIDVAGTAPTGTVNYPSLTNSGGDADGIHLVGNPFPSPIEWNGVAGFDGAMYIFEASGGYSGTFNDHLVAENYVIPSSQAFQVRVSGATSTFSVGNADRVASDAAFYRTESWYDQILVLDVDGNGFMDKTRIYFTEGASAALELADYDALKLESNYNQPTLFTSIDGEQIGTNGQAPLAEGPRLIPMGLKPGQDGLFTISVNTAENFPASAMILLEDLATGHIQNLMENSSYSFTMTTGEAEDRFVLHFVPGAEIAAIAADCDGVNGQLDVNLNDYSTSTASFGWDSYRLQNADGAIVASGMPSGSTLSFSGLNAGSYDLVLGSGAYEITENLTIERPLTAIAGFESVGTELYAGEPVQLNDRSEGSAEYRYDFGDGTILSGESNPLHIFAAAGEYTVTQEVWSADGCADASTQNLTIQERVGSGLTTSDLNNLIVWTQGLQVFVNADDLQAGDQVRLTDVLGRTVAQGNCNSAPCSIQATVPGAYILVVERDQSIQTRQVILQD